MNISAHNYTLDNLTNCDHTSELNQAIFTTINMVHKTSAVGGLTLSNIILINFYERNLLVNILSGYNPYDADKIFPINYYCLN